MRFIDLHIHLQQLILTLYILSITLEIICVIINTLYLKKLVDFITSVTFFSISILQTFAMLEILINKKDTSIETDYKGLIFSQSLAISVILLIIIFSYCILYIHHTLNRYNKEVTRNSIKIAFDNLPTAIGIMNAQGSPLLINRKMYIIIEKIFGGYYQNLYEITNMLEQKLENKNIQYIENSDNTLIKLDDECVYRFVKSEIEIRGKEYTQVFLSDVTREYNLSIELSEKNDALSKQKIQLASLLDDIVNIKREEEILEQKMYIHAKLGEIIVATNLFIQEQNNKNYYVKLWEDLLVSLEAPLEHEHKDTSLTQLFDAAKAIGCKINLYGKLPKDKDLSYLIITAMREAITNSIKHAEADEINVDILESDDEINVIISDNSTQITNQIKEGGGLSDLRKRIEKVGGVLNILCDKKITLNVTLPKKSIFS